MCRIIGAQHLDTNQSHPVLGEKAGTQVTQVLLRLDSLSSFRKAEDSEDTEDPKDSNDSKNILELQPGGTLRRDLYFVSAWSASSDSGGLSPTRYSNKDRFDFKPSQSTPVPQRQITRRINSILDTSHLAVFCRPPSKEKEIDRRNMATERCATS